MEKEKCRTQLLELIIKHAEYFLKESGEFFPFGGTVGGDNVVRSAAAYPGEEQPAPSQVIGLLNDAFDKGLESGQYKMVAIGVDVLLPEDWMGERLSAVQIMVRDQEGKVGEYHLPYFKDTAGAYVYLPLRAIV
ncbi:hypothetical protein GA0116948_11572 [Chitinophaga costaii]|uniref:Uncharacterized protein n=1 Tax=Chitinophaga costaii TaxID=1335309 RepID=A0A1C4FLU9_9BACT|nr:hypothetical protein [Chitinophaga costaii]PUZ29950.1 hypothetical protein DCM91_00245 [Chitinophaga costaii]SCC56979.1 hypothetical protein GA0116948_11572 [Chitinophaga costaii]